eukprot:GHVU01118239.1.p2 GENE.GHVU01118239.1~~GHVU01118239.1.p2  ORF type:complete len:172 (-),score=19.11 GHVU01118239.1:3077-3592(-)
MSSRRELGATEGVQLAGRGYAHQSDSGTTVFGSRAPCPQEQAHTDEQRSSSPFHLSTTYEVPGLTTMRHLGLVDGGTVRTRHLFRDWLTQLKSLLGGELKDYTTLQATCRAEATERMILEAQRMGANAIVGLRYHSADVSDFAAEFVCYGTAVVVHTAPPSSLIRHHRSSR